MSGGDVLNWNETAVATFNTAVDVATQVVAWEPMAEGRSASSRPSAADDDVFRAMWERSLASGVSNSGYEAPVSSSQAATRRRGKRRGSHLGMGYVGTLTSVSDDLTPLVALNNLMDSLRVHRVTRGEIVTTFEALFQQQQRDNEAERAAAAERTAASERHRAARKRAAATDAPADRHEEVADEEGRTVRGNPLHSHIGEATLNVETSVGTTGAMDVAVWRRLETARRGEQESHGIRAATAEPAKRPTSNEGLFVNLLTSIVHSRGLETEIVALDDMRSTVLTVESFFALRETGVILVDRHFPRFVVAYAVRSALQRRRVQRHKRARRVELRRTANEQDDDDAAVVVDEELSTSDDDIERERADPTCRVLNIDCPIGECRYTSKVRKIARLRRRDCKVIKVFRVDSTPTSVAPPLAADVAVESGNSRMSSDPFVDVMGTKLHEDARERASRGRDPWYLRLLSFRTRRQVHAAAQQQKLSQDMATQESHLGSSMAAYFSSSSLPNRQK